MSSEAKWRRLYAREDMFGIEPNAIVAYRRNPYRYEVHWGYSLVSQWRHDLYVDLLFVRLHFNWISKESPEALSNSAKSRSAVGTDAKPTPINNNKKEDK